MRPIVLHLIFMVLSCGGEDGSGMDEIEKGLQSFARRKKEIADAIIVLVEEVIQAEGERLSELTGSTGSQNTSSSKFQDVSRRIKEEVSNEVLSENELSRPKRKLLPEKRVTFGSSLVKKIEQDEVFEQGKIKEGNIVKEDTLKKDDKFVVKVKELFSLPINEDKDKKFVKDQPRNEVIELPAENSLLRRKRMFSPGRKTNFGRKRRNVVSESKEKVLKLDIQMEGNSRQKSRNIPEVIEVPAEEDLSSRKKMFSPGRTTINAWKRRDVQSESKEKVLESNVQIEENLRQVSRNVPEVDGVTADKDLSRKKRMFSPGRRTNNGRKRRDVFSESIEKFNVQIEKENSRRESRSIPHTVKKGEILSLKTDFGQNREDNIYPYTFSPFRGIFLFPFNTGFADFGNHLMVTLTTPRPSSITTLAPQKASPVHIAECSGISSSSCHNQLCTVECSDGHKVEVDCDNSNMLVKSKVKDDKIIVSVYCGEP